MPANAAPTVAALVARFLLARGVERIYGLQGGHIQPIWDHLAQLGVRIVDGISGATVRRNVIANNDLIEVVRSSDRPFEETEEDAGIDTSTAEAVGKIAMGRSKITRAILEMSRPIVAEFGIELVAEVRIIGEAAGAAARKAQT